MKEVLSNEGHGTENRGPARPEIVEKQTLSSRFLKKHFIYKEKIFN